MADGAIVSAVYKGDMPMRLQSAGSDRKIRVTIKDVYYHERIHINLLSWDCMRKDGWEMISSPKGTQLTTPSGMKINASTRSGLTILDDAGPERVLAARMGRIVCQTASDLLLLHNRVGHPSWGALMKMCRRNATEGIGDISDMSSDELAKAKKLITECNACTCGKQPKNSLGHRGLDKGTSPGEVLHMDVFYVMLPNPATGKKIRQYCLLGTDAYCNLRWVSKAESLRDIQSLVIQMIRDSTTITKRTPRLIVCDLGTEFENEKVKQYCQKHGIHLQPTPPRAKELNGVAEKSVDTVKNHMRTLLLSCGMGDNNWFRAVAHHVYLWNRTHISKNTGVTPYESTLKRQPSIINIGVFGCDAFVHQDRSQRDATCSPKAKPGIYLGHDSVQNCPIVFMLESGKTLKVKDVHFREGSFNHIKYDNANQWDQVAPIDFLGELTNELEEQSVKSNINITELNSNETESSNVHINSDGEEEYTVESIIGQRYSRGKQQYLVQWSGWEKPTWEPAAEMKEDVPQLVRQYEETLSHAEESSSRVNTRSRTAASSATVHSSQKKSDDSDAEEDIKSTPVLAARAMAARCL